MRKFLLLSALMCAIAGFTSSAATTSAPLLVTGGFYTTNSGKVVVHARGTGPTPQWSFETTPAVGFLRAPAVPVYPTGSINLSGKVTCIAAWLPRAVAVSGILDTPINGGAVRYFTLLINDEPGYTQPFGTPWIQLTGALTLGQQGGAGGPCGMSLFFDVGPPETRLLPEYHVTRGNLIIAGIS